MKSSKNFCKGGSNAIPRSVLIRHKEAFADDVENSLNNLIVQYAHVKEYCEYIRCLMIAPNESFKKKSIVIRNVMELARVVSAVDSVKGRYPRKGWSRLEKDLKRVFNYTYRFVKGNNSKRWDTGQYIQMMIDAGLIYCPYCNCHPLEAYPTGGGKTHKGPLDHFYDKARYPYLALSIYNLVPVCDQCNHEKLTKPTSLGSHTHPFHDDFHNLVVFSVQDPLKALYGNTCKIELCPLQEKRSPEAVKLACDIKLVNRYNAGAGRQIAHSVLDKGAKYRKYSINAMQRLAKIKRMSLEELYADEFGVKPDGTDIIVMAIILPANDIGRAGRTDPPSATHPEAAPYQFNTNINPGQHNNRRDYGKLRNDLMPSCLKK